MKTEWCAFLFAVLLCLSPTARTAGDTSAAKIRTIREATLTAFVKKLYDEMADPDEDLRRKTLKRVLPDKEDILALLPDEDAERLWPYMRKRLDKVIAKAPQMKGWQGNKMYLDNIITEITLTDIHASPQWQEDASSFLNLINKDIPAYWVVTHRDPDAPDRVAESGPYFFIDGQWHWIPNFHRVRPIILKLRRKAAKEAKNQ